MSLNKYNSTTGELEKIAGLVDDTDLKARIAAAEAVIPSGASASNQLVTNDDKYDFFVASATDVAAATAAYLSIKVTSGAVSASNALFAITTRSNTVGFLEMSEEDGKLTAPKVFLLDNTTSTKFDWMQSVEYDVSARIILISLSGNVKLSVNQVAGEKRTFSVVNNGNTKPSGTWVSGTILKLISNSDLTTSVTSGSSAPITSGGVYNAIETFKVIRITSGMGILLSPYGVMHLEGYIGNNGAVIATVQGRSASNFSLNYDENSIAKSGITLSPISGSNWGVKITLGDGSNVRAYGIGISAM